MSCDSASSNLRLDGCVDPQRRFRITAKILMEQHSHPEPCEVPGVQSVTIMRNPLNIVAAVGLTLGAVFGLAGTLVAQPYLRNLSWGIDSLGLVMAAAILTLKLYRRGKDFVAAGFLVFAIGEAVMLSGTAAGLAGSVPAFAAGTGLWATSLLLISIPGEFPIWVRLLGLASSVLFAITAARILTGEQLLPTSSPLPFFAYPFLVLTFIGWIWTLLKEA
jgi:hypothetical protein